MQRIVIYGTGGQASVIADLAEKVKGCKVAGFLDDNKEKGTSMWGYDILGGEGEAKEMAAEGLVKCVVAIGDNSVRKKKTRALADMGMRFFTLIHPFSSIGKSSNIGEGTVIFHGSVVDPDVRIGRGVILNHKAGVGHGSVIDDFVHLSAGVNCGANVTVGSCTFVGMGATIISGVNVGSGVFVGAGSLVTKDIPDNVRVVGAPVRKTGYGRTSEDKIQNS